MELWCNLISKLPFEWAQFHFMQLALFTAIVLCPLLAFLGCMVVNNQMAFFSDAIGHAALTGIAIGVLSGMQNPLWAMIIFSILLAIAITFLKRHGTASGDTVIGIVMSAAIALGIVILSRGGNFSKYSRFLIGDFLSISTKDIYGLIIVGGLFILVWATIFNNIFLVSVHTSLAGSRKIAVWKTQALFAVITALIVTICIQWVGILVINALIILPAAASRNIARATFSYFWIASGISVLAGISGLIISFYWSTASGATIVLFAAMLYAISVLFRTIHNKV